MSAGLLRRRVACGMSGGVDSTVSAMLLKNKGYEVLGVFMRNWDLTDETGHCSADADAETAEGVCKRLGIEFRQVNFVKEYWNEFSKVTSQSAVGELFHPQMEVQNSTEGDVTILLTLNVTTIPVEKVPSSPEPSENQTSTDGYFKSLFIVPNPVGWLLSVWTLITESLPNVLSSVLFDKSEGSCSSVCFGGILLCLLIGGVFEATKSSKIIKRAGLMKAVSLCRITPRDVMSDKIYTNVEEAFSHPRLAAVCFVFDVVHEITPVEALLLMDHILMQKARRKVEIYSFVENSALSVGYLLSLVGTKIFATEASVVGKLKFCKSPQPFSTSSKGKNYFDEIKLNEARFGGIADSLYLSKVALFRKNVDIAKVKTEVEGTWIGEEAKKRGLIDDIGNIHEFMAEKFPRAHLVTYCNVMKSSF